MSESFKTKRLRWAFNIFPVYRGTGGRVKYIRHDYRAITVCIPLNWRTRNYVGTIYGGSMFGATDPMYMLMLMENLGKDYVVWDKAGSIRFRRPAKETLYAHFEIDQALLDDIKTEVALQQETNREFEIQLKDHTGKVYAHITRTVYIADKQFYKNKRNRKKMNQS